MGTAMPSFLPASGCDVAWEEGRTLGVYIIEHFIFREVSLARWGFVKLVRHQYRRS